jgi:hypothetical protein
VSDFSFGRLVLLLLLVGIGAGVVVSLPEIRRYMKIKQM